MTIRTLTKFDLAKLLDCITPKNHINTKRLYKIHLTDAKIEKMGFDPIYFKSKRTFAYDETEKIISFFQFDSEELAIIKHK